MTRQEPHKPIKSNNKSENEEILVDSSSLPPKKMHNEKSERFGIPSSNEREAEYHETEQAQIATEYVTETSDVGVLSDSYPSTHTRSYDPIMSGAEPGYLTNQKETPASTGNAKSLLPVHQEEIVLSVSQDVADRQVQSQGRRLVVSTPSQVPSTVPSQSSAPSTVALQAFKDKCVASVLSENGIDYSSNPENSYVDCDGGYVRGTSQTCFDACNGDCCTGTAACGRYYGTILSGTGFTGKGE